MTWSYRVIRHADGHYAVHEVFYDERGVPTAMTQEPISFLADADEGPEAIVTALHRALEDARLREPLPAEHFADPERAAREAVLDELVAEAQREGHGYTLTELQMLVQEGIESGTSQQTMPELAAEARRRLRET